MAGMCSDRAGEVTPPEYGRVAWRNCKRVRDAQGVWCEECADMIWTVSHPYWGAGQVRALHQRGTGHAVALVELVVS